MPQHSLDCTHQNVLLPTSCFLVPSYWKWGFLVILHMWYDLHVSSDSKSNESKRSICMEFLHAYTPIDMVRMSQTFQNKWVQRSIDMELLHAFYTNMTQVAVPQVCGTIITILYLFGMNMCITTIEIHFRCKTIEGIIQINRVTIILLKWITVLR